ncbi:hypothetical protein LGK95_08480 [Clostridium algoriphilum]|uniref:hypothetical protein n=1 Tax=Clostridium algoriphilum TaxID=198347 RepID=UPI001CF58ADF|nr:hypothetical protein [Clostridium algoriphilum]MCB2293556.1 hypothetical protein [Clostridium algoriphilum]
MVISISFNNILIFVISILSITLLIYLIVVVKNINSVTKDVKYIFTKDKNSIDNTITSLPKIASNIETLTEDVKEGVHSIIVTSKDSEENKAQSSVSTAKKVEVALDYVLIFSEIVKVGINYFKKPK